MICWLAWVCTDQGSGLSSFQTFVGVFGTKLGRQ